MKKAVKGERKEFNVWVDEGRFDSREMMQTLVHDFQRQQPYFRYPT